MSNLDTLVEVSKIIRMFAGGLLCRRLLSNGVFIILLAVVAGMLVGALLIGGLYVAYGALIGHGFDATTAALIVSGIIVIAITLCAIFIVRLIRKLRTALLPMPIAPRIHNIASAFMDGFTESSRKDEHF